MGDVCIRTQLTERKEPVTDFNQVAMKKIIWLTLPLLLAIARVHPSYAQTVVSGEIAVNTTWSIANSPYRVIDSVRVNQGATLTIEAGVTVRFDTQTELIVHGRLDAIGTPTDSIFLIAAAPNPDTSEWEGLKISGSVGGRANLNYANVVHARNAFEILGNPSGIHLDIENAQVRHCARGLTGWPASAINMRRVMFRYNHIAALNADIAFRRCNFAYNDFAIRQSNCDVDSCTFHDNSVAAVEDASGTIRNTLFLMNHVAMRNFGGTPLDSVTMCQFVENDTAIVTATDLNTFIENEICANTVNVKVNTASNLVMAGNCWCSMDIPTIQQLIVDGNVDSQLGVLNFAVDSSCSTNGQVWPGDTDEDGTASIRDVLHIGVAYGERGPAREGNLQLWSGQPALPWDASFNSGVNYKHADCDGNGLVDDNDTGAIISNFGETHYTTSVPVVNNTNNGIPLIVEYPEEASVGDTIEINIRLGDPTHLATNVYGIALTITVDSTLFDRSSATASLSGTWMGTPGTDLMDLTFTNDAFHWGIVRNDHKDTTGYGRIGGVTMIMIDDLTRQIEDVLSVSAISLIDATGKNHDIDLQIVPTITCAEGNLTICPTPANERIHIMLEGLEDVEEVAIFNQNGLMNYRQDSPNGTVTVETATYSPGVYFLRVRVKNGLLTRKIIITR